MKKRKIIKTNLLLLLLIVCFNTSFTQIRHVRGVKTVNLNYSQSFESTLGLNVSYAQFFTNKSAYYFKYSYEKGIVDFTKFRTHTLNFELSTNLLKQRKYYLSPCILIGAGNEKLFSPLNENINYFLFQTGFGLKNEYYFSRLFAFNFALMQIVYTNSKLGKQYAYIETGFKLIINNIQIAKLFNEQ